MVHVVLVDEDDNDVGIMEKMEVHKQGLLHRAFSILIFNSNKELLLQKRAAAKYHSAGLWTNTCCSHPLPGEKIEDAAKRSLLHEMGINLQPDFIYKFIYQAELEHGLKEHELDYVFTGIFDGVPQVHTDEVESWKFMDVESIRKDIANHPEDYSCWFKIIMADDNLKDPNSGWREIL